MNMKPDNPQQLSHFTVTTGDLRMSSRSEVDERTMEMLKPVARASDVQELAIAVRGVLVSDQVKDYIISLVNATRTSPELRLGASPRATLQLLRASRAWAALDGRDYVIPDDVQALAGPVLAHRLLPTAEAIVERHLPEHVIKRIIAQLPLSRR